jgi:hypothetical protein
VNWKSENAKRRARRKRNTPQPPPESVSNRRNIVSFLQKAFDETTADPRVNFYVDPSSFASEPPVLRLRGGANNDELDETYQAARSKSLKEDVNSKLTKATVFASGALRHLRHVWFEIECDGMMGPGHRDTYHSAMLGLAGEYKV